MKINIEVPEHIDRIIFDVHKDEIIVFATKQLGKNSIEIERRIIRKKECFHHVQSVVNEIAEALK